MAINKKKWRQIAAIFLAIISKKIVSLQKDL